MPRRQAHDILHDQPPSGRSITHTTPRSLIRYNALRLHLWLKAYTFSAHIVYYKGIAVRFLPTSPSFPPYPAFQCAFTCSVRSSASHVGSEYWAAMRAAASPGHVSTRAAACTHAHKLSSAPHQYVRGTHSMRGLTQSDVMLVPGSRTLWSKEHMCIYVYMCALPSHVLPHLLVAASASPAARHLLAPRLPAPLGAHRSTHQARRCSCQYLGGR